jgi:hypothetical protein
MSVTSKEATFSYTAEDVGRFMAVAKQLVTEAGAMISSAIAVQKVVTQKESQDAQEKAATSDGNASSILTETGSSSCSIEQKYSIHL